jgi:hypothetical protein
MGKSLSVRFSGYSFGSVRVDGVTYDHDLIIDRGKIRQHNKGASRKFRRRLRLHPVVQERVGDYHRRPERL